MAMEFDKFELRVETGSDAGRLKLVWTAKGPEDPWPAQPYEISRGALYQSSDMVRDVLRQLAVLSDATEETQNPEKTQYREILRDLMFRGSALFENLFEPVDGNTTTATEASELLRTVGRETASGSAASLDIILCDETVHVPWGFAYICETTDLPQNVQCSIADLTNFWLMSFRLSVRFQGGSSRLPKPGRERCRALYALHEDLFTRARAELRRRNADLDAKLDLLMANGSISATTWTECQRHWRAIAEDYDSVLYMFGHSDGECIVLADGTNTVEAVLPASGFSSSFRKRGDTRSASICILNGCRTAAPATSRPWPASFLLATRRPGFFGFVGTEIEIPNTAASRYGVALLWRLCHEGEALGDAFDALRSDASLFPANLLYSCFANRNFRLPISAPMD
jgi:hypothetical protein